MIARLAGATGCETTASVGEQHAVMLLQRCAHVEVCAGVRSVWQLRSWQDFRQNSCDLGRDRTCNLQLRRLTRYPLRIVRVRRLTTPDNLQDLRKTFGDL